MAGPKAQTPAPIDRPLSKAYLDDGGVPEGTTFRAESVLTGELGVELAWQAP